MRACWQNTAGNWYEKLLLHGSRGKQAPDEDDTDDDEQSNIDIIVVQPETAEDSDEEEANDNILNHANDDLPCSTAGEIEVQSKKKFECS
ncbi:hypothetical protein AVEN_164196-1 [Araneus ventricosus]|uniref:Uncharacterized protein n=1 Tax=Araneus ventricosus TaxID=182803 RepID=A0A4Y2JQ76_ARAVE|nr:hypothetical protein AVEN_164196-1 [Araneus ventricosus]